MSDDVERWLVQLDGRPFGPFTFEQLQAVVEVGRADAETPACAEGDSVWMPLSDAVPVLFAVPAVDLELVPESAAAEPAPMPDEEPPPPPPRPAAPTPKAAPRSVEAPPVPDLPARKSLMPAEVARHCGVSLIQVLHWIQDGLLPAHKIAGRGDPIIDTADFVAFCKARQIPVKRGG
jgi:hypothetical protein